VLGAPNWYLFISPDVTAGPYAAGVLLTLLATAALVWWMWRAGVRGELVVPSKLTGSGPVTPGLARWLVSAALLSALMPPFLLPGMHERYFFAADVLSVLYAFYDPRRWYVAVLIQFASAFSYYPYLFEREPVPPFLLAAAVVLAIECVAIRLVQLAAMAPGGTKRGIP
jgi:hypothetical protein